MSFKIDWDLYFNKVPIKQEKNEKFIKNFIQKEKGKLSQEEIDTIIENANEVYNKYLVHNKTNVLMAGQVQSGKTKNYLAVLSKSFDEGFGAAIIFAGTTKNIFSQTINRIQELFSNSMDGEVRIRDFSFGLPRSNEIIQEQGLLQRENNIKHIYICLKEDDHLDKIKQIFKNKPIKTLLIDDEGDNASLNRETTKKDNDNFDHYSKINKELVDIMSNNLYNYNYLIVTATPYANLLQRKNKELFPNYINIIKPGKNYKGINHFHNPSGKIDNKVITPIFNYNNKTNDHPELITSVLGDFIITNSIIRLKNPNTYYQMIVNTSAKNQDHIILINAINDNIKKFKNNFIELSNTKSQIISMIEKYMENVFDDEAIKEFIKIIENKDNSYNELINEIKRTCDYINVYAMNQKTNYKNNSENYEDQIIVGSIMIGRGITFNNLRSVYITKEAKIDKIDTLLQRARWFGYRKEDIFLKLYMSNKLISKFESIAKYQNNFYEYLYKIESFSHKYKLNEMDFSNYIPDTEIKGITPTRKEINISLKNKEIYRLFQSRLDINNSSNSKKANDIVNKILDFPDNNIYKKFNHYNVSFDVNKFKNLFSIAEKKLICNRANNFSNKINYSFIYDILSKEKYEEIQVSFMRFYNDKNDNWEPEKRKISSNGNIEITTGQRGNYCGDRNLLEHYKEMTNNKKRILQIMIYKVESFLFNQEQKMKQETQYFFAIVNDERLGNFLIKK